MKIKASNWWTAGVASAVCLVLIVAIAMLSAKPSSDVVLRRPSTFFTDPSGARAIYLVLQRVLPSVEQWRLPITELKERSRQRVTTLIAMGPNEISQAEAKALDAWIESGGQLILAANTDWRVRKTSRDPAAEDFLERHDISSQPGMNSAVNAAVVKALGRGRIVYVPDSYAFSNRTLRVTDNAVWLTERCTEWGGSALFDEYDLGFAEQRGLVSLISMFAATPWGLVCVQLAIAGAVYMFGCKRRFGRPVEELPIERTTPIETVRAVGGLFETARARALSARTIHNYLNGYVSSILGYRIDLINEQARARVAASAPAPASLASPLRTGKTELDSYAEAANAAISERAISDAELIRFAKKATGITRSFSHGSPRSTRSAAAG